MFTESRVVFFFHPYNGSHVSHHAVLLSSIASILTTSGPLKVSDSDLRIVTDIYYEGRLCKERRRWQADWL